MQARFDKFKLPRFYTAKVPSPQSPLVFCAPTLLEARRSAWQHLRQNASASPLELPLILSSPLSFESWRALASENAKGALILPRLVAPELFFARAHGTNARQGWIGGVPRLWALASVLRRMESGFEHLDFDADNLDALRAMATTLAAMRRANLPSLPIGDDRFGMELDEWRAAYDRHLENAKTFDFEAGPALFAQSVENNRAFAFPKTLVVDDLPDIWPALGAGLNALIGRASTVCATLALPNGPNDEAAARALRFWTKHGAEFRFTSETDPESSGRLRVARALLGEKSETGLLPPDVSLSHAHTPHDEWERMAAHIRAQLNSGQRAREFCLVLADVGAQSPLMRAAFEAHGVPLAWRERDETPLIERVLRLLAPPKMWSVDALHDLFGDGALLLQWTNDEGQAKQFDAGRLRRAHRSVRGEGDEAAWRDPLALARDWEARIARLRSATSGRSDESRALLLARSLDGGDLHGISALKTLLAPLQNPLSALQWAGASTAILDAVCAHVQNDENDIAHRSRRAIKTLRAAIESVAARAGEDESERLASCWTAWLRLELSGAFQREDEEEVPSDGVRVLGIGAVGEAGANGEREIFLPGLSERAWPARPPRPLWPLSTATQLERLRDGEPAPLALALHGLSRAMATHAHLHLSHPAWSDGTETEASPLVEDVRALFPGATWPELALAETYSPPTSRGLWLRRQGQSQNAGTNISAIGETFALSMEKRSSAANGLEEGACPAPAELRPLPTFQNLNRVEDVDELPTRLRALKEMRSGRSDVEKFGRFDGVLGERGRELLAPLLPRDEGRLEVSASGLENYARCGLRFFFERVLELGDETPEEDDLSRAESGDLVHRVLHAFRREWSEPLNGDSFERARLALESHTKRECERLGLPPILRRAEARRLLGTPKRDGALVRLLRAECREADELGNGTFATALHPLVHLQNGRIESADNVDFGLDAPGNGLEQGFRLPLNGALVKGRIDRMDAAPDGSWMLVLDYKTGSTSSLPALHKGSDRLHFQLAVYVLAARHLTREWAIPPRIATAYLSPRSAFAGVVAAPELLAPNRQNLAMSEAARAQWLSDAQSQIERIARLIEGGTFNLSLRSAKDARCEWCAHSSMCGQNSRVQVARAERQLDSDVVFFPGAVEWKNSLD